jgi:hypothetical protein
MMALMSTHHGFSSNEDLSEIHSKLDNIYQEQGSPNATNDPPLWPKGT